MFYIGQKVVCVNDSNFRNRHLALFLGWRKPIKGEIYTIREIHSNRAGTELFLCLGEIKLRRWRWETGFHEGGWFAHRFKPIAKTDISIFTAMLTETEKETT